MRGTQIKWTYLDETRWSQEDGDSAESEEELE